MTPTLRRYTQRKEKSLAASPLKCRQFSVCWGKRCLNHLLWRAYTFLIGNGLILKFREVYVLLLYHPHLQGSEVGADLCVFLRGTVILWAHTQLQHRVKCVCSLRTPRQCSPTRCEWRTHILHNCTKLFLHASLLTGKMSSCHNWAIFSISKISMMWI